MCRGRQQVAQPPTDDTGAGDLSYVQRRRRCSTSGDVVAEVDEKHRAELLIVKPRYIVRCLCPKFLGATAAGDLFLNPDAASLPSILIFQCRYLRCDPDRLKADPRVS